MVSRAYLAVRTHSLTAPGLRSPARARGWAVLAANRPKPRVGRAAPCSPCLHCQPSLRSRARRTTSDSSYYNYPHPVLMMLQVRGAGADRVYRTLIMMTVVFTCASQLGKDDCHGKTGEQVHSKPKTTGLAPAQNVGLHRVLVLSEPLQLAT